MKIATLILACVLVAIGATACSSDAAKKNVRIRAVQSIQTAAFSRPETTVEQFLTWYAPKRESLGSLPMVPAWLSDDGDTTDTYKVDFKVVGQYLGVFKASGFVSENYLFNEQKGFQRADSVMRANRQFGGPAEGLNYDRVVFSQDPDADLAKLLRTKPLVATRGDTSRVFFSQLPKPEDLREGADLEFLLIKQQDKWVIEGIRPVFASLKL